MDENLKILCVDDDPSVLKALARLFAGYDYTVFTASSGLEGLKILERENVNIVISDYRMPGMNGVELIKEVYERRPNIYRIILSAYDDKKIVIPAINKGNIYKFITKPWDNNELIKIISNIKTAIQKQKAEKRSIERAEWFSTILASIGDAVIATDINGIVTFINHIAQDLSGWNKENVRGKLLTDIFKSINNRSIKEESFFSKVINSGVSVALDDYKLIKRDGSEAHIAGNIAPIRNANSEILGSALVISKKLEEPLSEKDRKKLINMPAETVGKLKNGKRLIPICAACKNIRDQKGYWNELEQYISDQFGVMFTHGMCPECSKEYYPQLFKD